MIPTRPSLTEAETREARLKALERDRPEAAAGRPIPELVEWVDRNAWAEKYAACMTNSGFVSTVEPGGSVQMRIDTEAQRSASEIAGWECSAKYSVDPAHDGTITPEQNTVIYEYYTQFFVPCAKAAGVKWKDPTIPSLEEFKQRTTGGEGMPWIPSSTITWQVDSLRIGDTATEEGKQFWKRCPSDPPYEYLYP